MRLYLIVERYAPEARSSAHIFQDLAEGLARRGHDITILTKMPADYMAGKLKSHGWEYIIVDIQWSEANPKTHGYRPNTELNMDTYGRLIPATSFNR